MFFEWLFRFKSLLLREVEGLEYVDISAYSRLFK